MQLTTKRAQRGDSERSPADMHFFYAFEESGIYDDSAYLVEPRYELLHRLLAFLAHEHLFGAGRAAGRGRARVLDLGPGTGKEAVTLARSLGPMSLLGVDVSDEMARRTLAAVEGCGQCRESSVQVTVADFFDKNARSRIQGQFDLAVSAFALHHGTPAQKLALYRWLFARLDPGGLFLNADLLRFNSKEVQGTAARFLSRWIRRTLVPRSGFLKGRLSGLKEAEIYSLQSRWLTHIEHENRELPFSSLRSQEGDRKGLPSEQDLLWESGFREVELPVRVLGAGIVWALR